MKKILKKSLVFFCLFIVVERALAFTSTGSYEIDGIYYDINATAKTASVAYKPGGGDYYYAGVVTIPSTVPVAGETFTVTTIGVWAFQSSPALTAVIIPNTVTTIEEGAFAGSGIVSVTIPRSVKSIEGNLFTWCDNLISINVDNGNTVYDSRDNCNAIIKKSTKALIAGCKNTIIPSTVTAIDKEAFRSCSGLTSITLPSNLKSIGEYAFYDCSGLSTVTLPNSLTAVGDHAFDGCSGISTITIPNSVTSIGAGSFSYCSNLTQLSIGSKVSTIGVLAFASAGLISVSIPSSVKSIGAGAFACRNLSSIKVESGNTVYDSRNNCNAIIETKTNKIISGCKNTTIPNGIIEIGERAFHSSDLTSIYIPNSVTSIGESAFYDCYALTSVEIPKSVSSIANNPFIKCSNLTHLFVEKGNSVYDSRDNCNGIIETKTNSFVAGCKCSFIPSSVTSIGNSAFSHCEDINSFYTGDNVSTIEKSAFSYCSGLEYVVIGKRVTSIEGSAFAHCTELTDIYCYAQSVPSLQTTSFTSSLIENATLHVPASSISAYSSDKRWKKFGRIVALTDNDPKASDIHQPRLNTNNVSTYWYDLKGHRLMNEPTQKGIYIHNGKVVKK